MLNLVITYKAQEAYLCATARLHAHRSMSRHRHAAMQVAILGIGALHASQ